VAEKNVILLNETFQVEKETDSLLNSLAETSVNRKPHSAVGAVA
jgi:ferritin-like metal-binding protein YciE